MCTHAEIVTDFLLSLLSRHEALNRQKGCILFFCGKQKYWFYKRSSVLLKMIAIDLNKSIYGLCDKNLVILIINPHKLSDITFKDIRNASWLSIKIHLVSFCSYKLFARLLSTHATLLCLNKCKFLVMCQIGKQIFAKTTVLPKINLN